MDYEAEHFEDTTDLVVNTSEADCRNAEYHDSTSPRDVFDDAFGKVQIEIAMLDTK